MKHQNKENRVTYNVSSAKKGILGLDTTYPSTKKRNLELDTTYQALKKEFWS